MARDPDLRDLAAALQVSIGLVVRRLRHAQVDGDLSSPESSALAWLDRGGPMTATALAKIEHISPQSMGATLGALVDRGLIDRRPDPQDGRQAVISVTDSGRQTLRNRRSARTETLAHALSSGFTRAELARLAAAAPLLERLAENI